MAKKNLSFNKKLQRLEEIVDILDAAEEPLEDLLDIYEEGMKLTNSLRDFLNKAEIKIIEIEKLSKQKMMNDLSHNHHPFGTNFGISFEYVFISALY